MNTTLEEQLVVGAQIKIGKKYAKNTGFFKEGEVITLINGKFDYDNGLYTDITECPAIWDESQQEFDSIYHLWGNDLSGFMDCEVLYSK